MTCSTTAMAAPFDLAWSAPAGCPAREQIVDATYAQLGEPRTNAAPELFVTGRVAERRGGFTITLSMTDAFGNAVGERVVPVDRAQCQEIVESTVLVLAMMIAVARPPAEPAQPVTEPQHEETSARATPAPEAAAPPSRVSTGRPVPPAQPKVPEAPRHRVFVGMAAVASRGVLPSTGLGIEVSGSYMPTARLLLGLDASFEQALQDAEAGGSDVGFRLFRAGIRVGLSVLRTERFELVPTVGAWLALIQNSPEGFQIEHYPLRSTFLVGPGGLARVRLARRLFLDVFGDVEAVLVRDRFNVRVDDKLFSVHRPSTFAGRAGIGLGFDFR